MNKQTGILGGTFNPIHNGHLELGKNILHQFKLDNIFYVLSAHPPHKSSKNLTPAQLRWKILKACLEPYKKIFHPIDIEMKYQTPSWTIDTILRLKKQFLSNDFYFISGSEGFLKIRTWKEHSNLLKEIPFIIILRDKTHLIEINEIASEECLKVKNITKLTPLEPALYIYNYESSTLNISSTLVRNLNKNKKDLSPYLSKTTLKFIKEYNLYEV